MDSSGAGHPYGSRPLSSTTATHRLPSHIPVEMSELDASKRVPVSRGGAGAGAGAGAGSQGLLNNVSVTPSSPIDDSFSTSFTMPQSTTANENTKPAPSTTPNPAKTSRSSPNPSPTPAHHEMATTTKIGESISSATPEKDDEEEHTNRAAAANPSSAATGEAASVLLIQLLPQATARQVPFNIDEKYLAKRGVDVPSKTEAGKADPYSISVYTLKELILRSWREEWETKPTNPTNIRLIFYGRMLDDKSTLADCRFSSGLPNILHMTVRPQDIVDEEDGGKNKQSNRDRDGEEETAGCRCVIQ